MKTRANAYFFLIVMIIMLATIVWSLRMDYFLSKLLPIIIASIVFVLAATGLIREVLGKEEQTSKTTKGETDGKDEAGQVWHDYLRSGSWILGFLFAVYLLGFITTIPMFVLGYMKSQGVRWLTALTSAVLTPIITYGIFEVGLQITLYRGLLFSLLES